MLIILLSIVLAVIADRYYLSWSKSAENKQLAMLKTQAWKQSLSVISQEISNFNGEAGIIIKDLQSNRVISFNGKKPFPSASLAKIPVMAACFQASQEGKLKLSDTIKLKQSDKMPESGILKDVILGKDLTIEDLLEFMIAESDNTATNILTNKIGLSYLNNYFKRLGLANTNLARKIADFKSRDRGVENYTTAEDIAYILEKIYNKSLVSKEISEKCLRLLKLQRKNDRIPKYLPAEITVAHKTGLERSVCHDAGIVFTPKGDFLICVLTKHKNSNSIPSKEFIARIAMHIYKYLEKL